MKNSNKTGYVYDPIFLKHDQAVHPENAKRLEAIIEELKSTGLLNEMIQVPSRYAMDEEIMLVHSKSYINYVKELCKAGGGYFDGDTYATSKSFDAAATAAGSIIDLGLNIAKEKLKNGFALLRPPGHHSLSDRAMGFCIFSNAAIAAKSIQKETEINRIAIVDFDVHHGNGTEEIFSNDPNVLYVSSHQFPHYPGTGSIKETGREDGNRNIVNIPLPAFSGDNSIKLLYEEILTPILNQFMPEMIIVSAGYDCHWNDPLANFGFSLNGIAWISEYLVKLADKFCGGKILFTLEGGYNLDVLKNGVANSVRALLGRDDFSDPMGRSPRPEPNISGLLDRLKYIYNLRYTT
ncbi:histone deacetylase [Bacteroidota bacterium]